MSKLAVTPSGRPTRTKVVASRRHAPTTRPGKFDPTDFSAIYRADPLKRVEWVKAGIPAGALPQVAQRMAVPQERLMDHLGLPRSTITRKLKQNLNLSSDESSRVLGIARLVGQAQALVEESGDPTHFDAATWVAAWLEQPLPALGGRKPAALMDTPEGQQLVSSLLAQIHSGSYV